MHYLRRDGYAIIILLLSIKSMYYLEIILPLLFTGRYKYSCIAESCIAESCIAESCIAEIMHRESIIMHDEKISCLVKIYTSREEFMPRWNSCIAEIMHRGIMHRESLIMHDEKISCLVKIYARREEFMPRQICTSREGFIPR